MKIKFFNHACFSIENDQVILLNDPYLSGTAFNDGWDLIVNDIEFNFDTKKKLFIYFNKRNLDLAFFIFYFLLFFQRFFFIRSNSYFKK